MSDRDVARVVYLGGRGRSGSTLLGRLLGRIPGIVFPGEIRFVWARGVVENRLCGCGEPFGSCVFWQGVGAAAFGGWGNAPVDEVLRLDRALLEHKRLHRIVRGKPSADLVRYRELIAPVYAGIRSVSGCDAIVDSAKNVAYAYALAGAPGIDMRLVHLVRDSRGVAYAWTKKVERPDAPGSFMPRYSVARSSMLWMTDNLLLQRLGARAMVRVRYEDLVREPGETLQRIAETAGIAAPSEVIASLAAGSVGLEPDHTVSGNPMRFGSGTVKFRLDEQWRDALPRRRRAVVSAMTWPLLRSYGYQSARKPEPASRHQRP